MFRLRRRAGPMADSTPHTPHVSGKLYVGKRNPDPQYPDEIAIMADIAKGQLIGPDAIPAKRAGSCCIAVAMPTGVRPDPYPAFTEANAARLVAAWNAV